MNNKISKMLCGTAIGMCPLLGLTGCESRAGEERGNGANEDTSTEAASDINEIDDLGKAFPGLISAFSGEKKETGILPREISKDEKSDWVVNRLPGTGNYKDITPLMLSGRWKLLDGIEVNGSERPSSDEKKNLADGLAGADQESYYVFPLNFTLGLSEADTLYDNALPTKLGDLYRGSFQYAYDSDVVGYPIYTSFYGVYDVNDQTLALGLSDMTYENAIGKEQPDKIHVNEVDYGIEWTGYQLTLTYGDSKATYVPSYCDYESDGSVSRLPRGYYLEKGSECYENLYGISGMSAYFTSLGTNEGKVNYAECSSTFKADGTAVLSIADGAGVYGMSGSPKVKAEEDGLYAVINDGSRIKICNVKDFSFQYWLSDDSLTLEKDGKKYYFLGSDMEEEGAEYADASQVQAKVDDPEIFDGTNQILPDEVKKDSDGNWTYQSPAKAGDHSLFTPEMFYGRWELKGGAYDSSGNYYSTSKEETDLGYAMWNDNRGYKYCTLPSEFSLGYAVMNGQDGIDKEFGGLVLGKFTYPVSGNEGKSSDFVAVYDVSADTLAIGFTNMKWEELNGSSEVDSFKIGEMDYTISWEGGVNLTLSYGGETATYVPQSIDYYTNTDGSYQLENRVWLGAGQQPQGSIYGIAVNSTYLSSLGVDKNSTFPNSVSSVLQLNPNGNAALTLKENEWANGVWGYGTTTEIGDRFYSVDRDGNRVLLNSIGNKMTYDRYYYSGNVLTLISGGNRWIYYDYSYGEQGLPLAQMPEDDYQVEPPASESFSGTAFNLNGSENEKNVNFEVEKLLDAGYKTSAKMEQKLPSRGISDTFDLQQDGASLEVVAVNPYSEEVPVKDALVSYVGFSDTSGKLTVGEGITCGKSTTSDITAQFTKPVKTTDDMLIYRTENASQDFNSDYGDLVLNDQTTVCYVVFNIEKGTLISVEFESPGLLFNDLADNIGDNSLADFTPDVLTAARKTRDGILDSLNSAFTEKGIQVDIDSTTGKISMADNILFGFNESSLVEEGRSYLDTFLAVYVDSILHGSYSQDIREVRFDGYTDTVGSYEYNLKLSQKRADNVMNYCVTDSKAGVSSSDLAAFGKIATAVGHSYENPVYDSKGAINMDASRRVEIKFFLNITKEWE